MIINDRLIDKSEKTAYMLQELYLTAGYSPFRLSKFEEYDLYAGNKDFLVSDNVITFTDTSGKLMALKPDVTLSIIKNSRDVSDGLQKVFYTENVYRVSKSTGSFKEILQTGLEMFGNVTEKDISDVLGLAAESLKIISEDSKLTISNLDCIDEAVKALGLPGNISGRIYKAIEEKNVHEIRKIASENGAADGSSSVLEKMVRFHGTVGETIAFLGQLPRTKAAEDFTVSLRNISEEDFAKDIVVDFSVISDVNYYNGIVFKGFINGVPSSVLSGGQYNRLMKRMQKKSKAIGFAVYTDLLERLDEKNTEKSGDSYLNVALPKGRLGEKIYAMFAEAGYECPSILEPNRKLFFENPEKKVRYFWVKPSDVAIYVERGAADIGVAGKDILVEYEPEVYELLDLNEGNCRMAVAGPKNFRDGTSGTLRVATKFTHTAREFYLSKGREIDFIHLNGSIEIAPLLGLSDVIVDIVETGATLRENNLDVIETIYPISARLIANKASFKFKSEEIEKLAGKLSEIVEKRKND